MRVNSQPLTNPLVCLGDGHDGIWNLVGQLATPVHQMGNFGLVSLEGKSLALLGGR